MNYDKEIKDVTEYIERMSTTKIYSPMTLDGNIIRDGKRLYKDQNKRIYPIISKIKTGGTLLDLGCNVGYIMKEIIKERQVKATGVDHNNNLIKLCKDNFELEEINVSLVCDDIIKFINKCMEQKIKYDYVLFLSVFDFDGTMMILDNLLKITRRRLFLEPTNHEKMTAQEQKERYKISKLKDYRSSLLAFTDYQERGLYVVFKEKN